MHDRVRMHTRTHTLARTYVHAEVNTNEYACKRTCARLHVRLLSDLGTSGLGCLYAHSHTPHARTDAQSHAQTDVRTDGIESAHAQTYTCSSMYVNIQT